MRRGKYRSVVLVALMLVGTAVACSDDDDGAASTAVSASEVAEDPAERLHGTWNVNQFGSYHTWEPDGTWYVTTGPEGDPYDFGTYTIDGSILTLDTDRDSPECPATSGSYEVTFVDADTISWELIDDECASRGRNIPRTQWERVETD